jgi:hypothetical protein
VWLYLKKATEELSTTHSTPATPTKENILERLSAIDKKISAPHALLLKQPTYTDLTHLAPSQNVNKKPVRGRDLKEVTVKINWGGKTIPNQ